MPLALNAEALAALALHGRRMCSFYAALSTESPQGWKLTPKFHLLLHLVEHQAPLWGNPKHFWCYCDEDMIGHMVEVASSCHPSTMSEVALYKYALLLSMQ